MKIERWIDASFSIYSCDILSQGMAQKQWKVESMSFIMWNGGNNQMILYVNYCSFQHALWLFWFHSLKLDDIKKREYKHQHSEMKYFGPKVNKTILKSSTEKHFVKFAQQKFSENLKVVQPKPAHHSPPPEPLLSYQQTIF